MVGVRIRIRVRVWREDDHGINFGGELKKDEVRVRIRVR
jgi:hypothetical protein